MSQEEKYWYELGYIDGRWKGVSSLKEYPSEDAYRRAYKNGFDKGCDDYCEMEI